MTELDGTLLAQLKEPKQFVFFLNNNKVPSAASKNHSPVCCRAAAGVNFPLTFETFKKNG